MMSKRSCIIIVFILAVFGLSYFAKRSINDSKRQVSQKRERIVAMAPSTCEVLYALGLGDKVVGVSKFTTYPEDAVSKPKIGGYVDVDLEALVALRPDVVVLLEGQMDLAKLLQDKGMQTVIVSHMSVGGIQDSHRVLGEYFGVANVAEAVVREMNERIHKIAEETEPLKGISVLISIGRERGDGKVLSLTAAGSAGYHQELLGMIHAENAYRGSEPFPKLTLEHILTANPDVIIDIVNSKEAEAVGVEAIANDWLAHPELKAVRDGRVFVLAGDQHFVPGPRFVDTLDWIAQRLMDGGHDE